MSKWLASSAAALVLCAGVQANQEQAALRPALAETAVPGKAVSIAKRGSVGDFGRALASAGIPTGMVIRRADARPTSALRATPQSEVAQNSARLDEVAAEFSGRNADYLVTNGSDGGVFVTPRQSPCEVALRRTMKDVAISSKVYAVGYEFLKALNPNESGPPPGLVGSGPGGENRSEPLIMRPVFLHFQWLTLHQALDEVARQVPGLIWVLVSDGARDGVPPKCVLQWWTETDTASTSYDFLQLQRGSGRNDQR